MIAKLRILFWIGIIILFLPFFGVPDWLRTALTIAIGIVIIYLTFSLRRSYKKLRFELRQGAIVPQPSTEPTIHA